MCVKELCSGLPKGWDVLMTNQVMCFYAVLGSVGRRNREFELKF